MTKILRALLLVSTVLSLFPHAAAQSSPSLAIGNGSGASGSIVSLPIIFTAGATQVAALQCSVSLPIGWSMGSVSTGPAATSAAKMIGFNQANGMIMVFGTDQETMATGVVANVQINIPSSAASGTYPVALSGVILAAADGSSVQPAASGSGSVTVQSGNSGPAIISFTANPASITLGSSTTLSWNVTGASTLSIAPNVGTVTGTSISVSPTATTTYTLTASNSAGSTTATTIVTVTPFTASSGPLQFVPVVPCRVADTRNPSGPFGGPEMPANSTRVFSIPAGPCSIPATAAAYSLNVTAVPDARLGYLTIWPTGQPQPYVSTLNSDGRVKSNAAIVPAGGGGVSVYVTDSTQVIIDIDGYFVPAASSASALAFYSLPPCRVADTRQAAGPLAGPYLSGGAAGRSFPILSSSCSIPATAQAYSLNLTAVPHGPLSYLTVWPSGQNQPVVSTLNASTGTTTANAALVPAGNGGDISVYASNDTDLVIDINGYFAAPGRGGLSLYTLAPCRVLDTRNPPGSLPFTGTLVVNVVSSSCAVPFLSLAYVLNATVVPQGTLQYLMLGPDGQEPSVFSTLNALDGAITSNMAIVSVPNGLMDAFTTNPTYLVLDISGYFAP